VVDEPDVPDNYAYSQYINSTQSASPAASTGGIKTPGLAATGPSTVQGSNTGSSS